MSFNTEWLDSSFPFYAVMTFLFVKYLHHKGFLLNRKVVASKTVMVKHMHSFSCVPMYSMLFAHLLGLISFLSFFFLLSC